MSQNTDSIIRKEPTYWSDIAKQDGGSVMTLASGVDAYAVKPEGTRVANLQFAYKGTWVNLVGAPETELEELIDAANSMLS